MNTSPNQSRQPKPGARQDVRRTPLTTAWLLSRFGRIYANSMKLTLRNKTFALKSAKLSAAIPDPYWSRTYKPNGDVRLFWSLNVNAKREADGEMWQPRVYHENLHFPICGWTEVVGQMVEWSEWCDKASGEPNGGFYVFEHGDIPRARLRFLERDGISFRFDWVGVSNVFWDEKDYCRDVPFSASGWAEFTGVTVRGSKSDTDETLRGRLAQYLDLRDFGSGPLCKDGHFYESGVGMAHAHFSPSIM